MHNWLGCSELFCLFVTEAYGDVLVEGIKSYMESPASPKV